MELVPKIDAVKTCKNVSDSFKDDLEKMVLMSGNLMGSAGYGLMLLTIAVDIDYINVILMLCLI